MGRHGALDVQCLRHLVPIFTPKIGRMCEHLRAAWATAEASARAHTQRWAHRQLDELRFVALEVFLGLRVLKVWPALAAPNLGFQITGAIELLRASRSPRASTAWLKTLLLGWATPHRLQRDRLPCPFCGAAEGDAQPHLLRECAALHAILLDADLVEPPFPAPCILRRVALPTSSSDVRLVTILHHFYAKVAFAHFTPAAAMGAFLREFPPAPPLPQRRARALRPA